MTQIDSLDDPRVADYRLLTQPDALRRRGLFVVEGRLILRRIVALPRFRLRSVLLKATAHNALNDILDRLDHAIPVFVALVTLTATSPGSVANPPSRSALTGSSIA